MLRGQVCTITVSTPDKEYALSLFGGDTVEQAIDRAQVEYPEWTSLIVVIVP